MHAILRRYVILTGVLLSFVVGAVAQASVPVAGDFDADQKLDADDIDQLTAAILAGQYSPSLDLNADSVLNGSDRIVWVEDLAETYFGDTNLNRVFNTGDLVHVFQAGHYDDQVVGNSTWATGDWNGDAEFDSGDLVLAFGSGGFEGSPRLPKSHGGPLAVPEPSAIALLALGLAGLIRWRR